MEGFFHYEILSNNTKVYTNNNHKFNSDALLLSRFCKADKALSICELGSGCGTVLFDIWDRGYRKDISAVEISTEACSLMAKTISENNINNFYIHNCNLKDYKSQNPFDIVISNPPYFSNGLTSGSAERANARHLLECSIESWCQKASSLLKHKGRFFLCYPPAGLPSLFNSLTNSRLAPSFLQFVKNSPNKEPWLCLIEASKRHGSKEFNPNGLKIMPDKIIERCFY